jgi:hypothetical protein
VFPVGGVGVMLLVGALSVVGLAWSLVVIALVTLIPAQGAPGIVYAEDRLGYCSMDLGGPAPDGFWIFTSGQRALNTVLFVPSGALVVLAAATLARRWRGALELGALGFLLLAAYALGIEFTQLELARLDRACDVTDFVDNVVGAALGLVVGLALLPLLRPWRRRRS